MINWRETERRLLSGSRLVTLVAVISSFAGSLLMFWLGLGNTWNAFATQFGNPGGPLPADELTVIHLIGALDRFLIAIVLMFFGYGVYVLFVRPEATPPQLGLPQWLHVGEHRAAQADPRRGHHHRPFCPLPARCPGDLPSPAHRVSSGRR